MRITEGGYKPKLLTIILAACMPFSLAAAPGKKKPKDKKKDVEAIGDRKVGGGINFYSLEKEIALGKRLATDVERHAKIIDDPIIAEYVNRVGQNLVRNSDARVPFTIKVIDSQEVNAFALPGGFFFVNSGLILKANSEAQLAGVMAHEIAHVAARHGTKRATKGRIMNLATIPLIFLGGWTGYGIRQAAGFAMPITFLKFSRKAEAQADFLGLQYMWKAGYDPTALIGFFETLRAAEKRKPGTISKLFKSHPPKKKRIKKSQKTISEILPDRPQYVVSTSEFLDVRERLATLTRMTPEKKQGNRPRLRRSTSGGTVPAEDSSPEGEEEDERPTLKRR